MVVAGVYLFYVGSKAPGGAFQAGAVLGALAVLLLLAGLIRPPLDRGALLRAGLTFGLGVFLLAGCVGLLTGVFLEYPPDWDYAWILLIEFTLTVSIALTLTALFVAAAPRERTEAREDTHQGGEGAR
jgi:multisubunit Na+/H+ antiporter MnhB subunit